MDRDELNQTLHGVSLEDDVMEMIRTDERLVKWTVSAVNYCGNGKYLITAEIDTEDYDDTH